MSPWSWEMSPWSREMNPWRREMSPWRREMSPWRQEMSLWRREMNPWKSEARTSSRYRRFSAEKGRTPDWKPRHSGSEECFPLSEPCSSQAKARAPAPVQSRRGWYSRRSHRWSACAELRASVPWCEAHSVNPPNPDNPVQKERQDYRDFMDEQDCALQGAVYLSGAISFLKKAPKIRGARYRRVRGGSWGSPWVLHPPRRGHRDCRGCLWGRRGRRVCCRAACRL